MKYINADELRAMMFHGAFEEDSDLQRWDGGCWIRYRMFERALEQIEPADVVEVVRCKDCKLNPKYEWFGCPMSHLSEKQRPETAWCWKAERRTDE